MKERNLYAAIYARKSTDDNDAGADNKSVARQVDHAKRFAEKNGWTVHDEHVYIDDNISGAEYQNRPGLHRMLGNTSQFGILIMSEASRLGRDMMRNAPLIADILESDVRVFYYLTSEEEKADTPEQRIMLTLRNYASEVERLKAGQRSRDALQKRAERGFNTGGLVYGYDNVKVMTTAGGEQVKLHTDYKINDVQAEVVRCIFRMYAAGHGHVAIAKTMNGDPRYSEQAARFFNSERPASPRKGTGSWAPSSIRAILYNDRYTGIVPFGEHQNVYRKGAQKRVKRERFLKAQRPDLRIVPEDLWQSVQARLKAVAQTYLRDTNGNLWGRPATGFASRYLLTGLGRCATCGANMVVIGGQSGVPGKRKRIYYYGCSHRQHRGGTVCGNANIAFMEDADEAVLNAVAGSVLTPERVNYVIDRAVQLIAERQAKSPDVAAKLATEIAKAERRLENLIELAAEGKAPDRVMAKIREGEAEIARKRDELLAAEAQTPTDLDLKRIRRDLASRMGQFQDLIRGDIPRARTALGKLLVGKIEFVPTPGTKRGYTLRGQTTLGPLLRPEDGGPKRKSPAQGRAYPTLASPRGFARAISGISLPSEVWLEAA